jgi:acyl-CoA thioesterase FadM
MQELIDSYLPAPAAVVVGTVEPDLRLELPGARQGIDFGPAIYVAPKAPRVEPELVSLTFDTTSAESNLVGNVYYANYYRWAGRVIDRFFHSIALKQGSKSPRGQVVCRAATVRHLREAMPFDRIEVVMALRGLYQGGLELHFAFYKLTDDGERSKLAVGELEGVWMDGETGKVGALPEHLVSALAERSRAAA